MSNRKTEDEIRLALCQYTESELKSVVREYTGTITFRTYENGCSRDVPRPATEKETEILYAAILASLYMFRCGNDRVAVMTACEMMADILIPGMNGYDSVYCPTQRIINRLAE